jgi:hypothetical protein
MIVHLIRISLFTAALLGVQSSRATGQVYELNVLQVSFPAHAVQCRREGVRQHDAGSRHLAKR